MRVSLPAGIVNVALARVASKVLCKFREGLSLPGALYVTHDTVHDPIAAVATANAGDRSRPSLHVPEGTLVDIGCPHRLPIGLRDVETLQECR